MKKILIFGANGQVGWELGRCLASLSEVKSLSSQQVNLTQPDDIVSAIHDFQPTVIVNAAAYTAVDKAESEPEVAKAINATAPGVMAKAANELNALLIHYSTDYVYQGHSDVPYTEADVVAPNNVYGQTKLAGDQAIEAIAKRYWIFRTSWVYTDRGGNFLLTMQRLMKERDALSIVGDQIGSPTWSRVIADVTAQALSQAHCLPETNGVYHLSCEGQASWFEFAAAIRDLSGLECDLSSIKTVDYPTPASRPLYSVMSGDKLADTFGLRCPDWLQALKLCLG